MHKVYLEDLIIRQEGFPYFSRELIEAHQLELLNVQLNRAKALSTFYASYPNSVKSLSELQKLPFTTEEMLRKNYSKLCLASADDITRIRTELTSGTSGTRKKIAYSEYDSNRTVEFFENGLAELIFPNDKVIVCFPYTDRLSLGGLIAEAVTRLGAIPICAGTNKTYGEYLEIINENNVSVYLGPPVLLLSLLRFQPDTTLKRALVSGDRCGDSITTQCEKILGSKLFPHYGSRETGLGCAYTCSAHEGMHIRENDIICEIIDPVGNVLPNGQWGELVITTIGLDAMPLFRYKTGDFARLLNDTCPCNSAVRRMEVAGRIGKSSRIGHFDDLLFAFDEIIDFSISGNSAIISCSNINNELSDTVHYLCRGLDIKFIQAQLDHKPMYAGKRRIL